MQTRTNESLRELVDALVIGTTAGQVRWKRANSRGTAFVASRSSGAVTIERRGTFGAIVMRVVDRDGVELESYASGSAAPPDVRMKLDELYRAVEGQFEAAHETIRTLANEFRRPG